VSARRSASAAVRAAGGVAAVAACAAFSGADAGAAARPSRDGPIPGFSGGFGESSCAACHFDYELNEAPGSLTLAGVPERYTPGTTYPLTLTLVRPGIALGGFQLTARFERDGAQAGVLAVGADGGRIATTLDRGVQYAHHLRAGASLVAPDTARWTIAWTAPAAGGAVSVHVAANAADGDDSQLGDRIYTTAAVSRPPDDRPKLD
jgi:hypothetical protein